MADRLRQGIAVRALVARLCALGLALAPAGAALAETAALDDPEATMVSEVTVVAPAYGPAWWKVSKGDSVAWILALPPTIAPLDLKWDTRTLERRLNGARALYLPPDGRTELYGRWLTALPAYTQARIALAAVQVGFEPQGYIEPPTLPAVIRLSDNFRRKARLGFDPTPQIASLARRARVPVYKSPGLEMRVGADTFNESDAEVAACLAAMLEEVETDPAIFRALAVDWAQGRPDKALAGPRGALPACMNRMMPGYARRLIEAQTGVIAQALQQPGKVVVVVPMRQLLAQEGVLQRLKSQGFTVADPRLPLTD